MDEYKGSKNKEGLPHGKGINISKGSDGKIKCIEEGNWENGFLIEGSETLYGSENKDGGYSIKREIGKWRYDKQKNFCEEFISGEGEELYYKNEEDLKNNRLLGYVKGIFDNGVLLKGEVLNPFLINYSEVDFIKRIVIKGKSKRNSNPEGNSNRINIGEIFFHNGDHYEGEIDFDMPQGEGTMTYNDGSKKKTKWINGNPE